jgi:diguanylate cyclase (GGDEF)-like protein/PAS domain S-box-containing protein
LALGAVLVGGYRLLPGVWLGSFAANVANGFDASSGMAMLQSLAIPATVGFGATLQAALTCWAIRHWINHSTELIEDRDIARFYLLAGPLGSLVNASFSVPFLTLIGRIPAGEADWNWFTWWAGDTVGSMIFTPMALMLLGEPRAIWRYRFRSISLPLLLAFTLTAGMFVHERSDIQRQQRLEFERHAEATAAVLNASLGWYVDILLSAKGFLDASQQVTREEFHLFANQPLLRKQGLLALEWAAWVGAAEREAIERKHQAEGWKDFHITEKAANGRLVPAQQRARYIMLEYVEPFSGNEPVFGYDLASEPTRAAALQSALESGGVAATAPLILVQEQGKQKGILLVTPVFSKTQPKTPVGFVIAVLRVADAINVILAQAGMARQNLRFMLEDEDADPAHRALFREEGLDTSGEGIAIPLNVAGRHWTARFFSIPNTLMTQWSLWYVIGGGMALTGLLGGFLLTLTGRTLRVEALVRERTQSLRKRNQQLRVEIIERERSENELRESEERFRGLVEALTGDLILIRHNAEGVLDYASPSIQEVLGYAPAEVVGRSFQSLMTDHPNNLGLMAVEAGLGGEPPPPYELEVWSKDNLRHWLWVSKTALRDAQGKVAWMQGVARDITKEKKMRENLRAIVDSEPACVMVLGEHGALLEINASGLALFGAAKAGELIGHSLLDWLVPEQREAFLQFHARVCAGQAETLQFEVVNFEGRRKWVESHSVPLCGDYGGCAAHLSITLDITQRLEAENRLRLAARVFTESTEGIFITDAQGIIVDVNESYCALTGYPREEAIGQAPRLFQAEIQDAEFHAQMWEALKRDGHWRGEVWNRKKSGELYAEKQNISAVHDAEGQATHYVAIFSDITQTKKHQQHIEHLAYYDALTQLPNRVLLADRLQLALSQAQRSGEWLAVGYLDLDDFKPVNDTYGHKTGDTLLRAVAARIRDNVRAGDTVARLGGDEFALLLVGVASIEECHQTLARLLEKLAAPFFIEGHEIKVSASIGVTLFPHDGANADALLRHADQAMYQAKAGRNCYHFFDTEHDQRTRLRREALERIHAALPQGEFVLYYQPKVDMRQGWVIGAEALIRWQHPERGLVPPGEFIPLIEGTDFALTLGEWVIAQALAQMRSWLASGLEFPISVNISAWHLMQPGFCQRLAELLAACPEVPPRLLELEILETTAVDDISRVSEIMKECRQLGVGFALDDFGTGYSSLTYLRRLSVDVVKIDQSFVRDMLQDPEDLAIVSGIIGLTHAFLRQVIAEGVETPAHGARLLQMGCDWAQGYGIARPMPAAALPRWIAGFLPDPSWKAKAP